MLLKRPRFRSRRLLDSARGQSCKVQLPGVCNHDPATVVAAHSNLLEHGSGIGLKSHDYFTAEACSACHDAIDGRSWPTNPDTGDRYTPEEIVNVFDKALARTLESRFERGVILVV